MYTLLRNQPEPKMEAIEDAFQGERFLNLTNFFPTPTTQLDFLGRGCIYDWRSDGLLHVQPYTLDIKKRKPAAFSCFAILGSGGNGPVIVTQQSMCAFLK